MTDVALNAQETQSYKQAFNRLRDLKPQIQQLQAVMQRHSTESAGGSAPGAAQHVPQAAAALLRNSDTEEALQRHGSRQGSTEQPVQLAAAAQTAVSIPAQQPAAAPMPAMADDAGGPRQPAEAVLSALKGARSDNLDGDALSPASQWMAVILRQSAVLQLSLPCAPLTRFEPHLADLCINHRPSDVANTAAAALPAALPPAVSSEQPHKNGHRWGGVAHHSGKNGESGGASSCIKPANDFSHVDPEVMAQAKPLLTGNAVADRNIVRFYEARAQLLRRQQASTPL